MTNSLIERSETTHGIRNKNGGNFLQSAAARRLAEVSGMAILTASPISPFITIAAASAYETTRFFRRKSNMAAEAAAILAEPDVHKTSTDVVRTTPNGAYPINAPIDSSEIVSKSVRRSAARMGVGLTFVAIGQLGIPSAFVRSDSGSVAANGNQPSPTVDPLEGFQCTINQPLLLQTSEQHSGATQQETTSIKAVQLIARALEIGESEEGLLTSGVDGFWGPDTQAAYSQIEPLAYGAFSDDKFIDNDVTLNGVFDGRYECLFVTTLLQQGGYDVTQIRDNIAIANAA